MEKTYIQWNIANWITVFLMVSIGGLIVTTVAQYVRKMKGG